MLPRAICFMLLLHFIRAAASRIFWTAGSNRPIRIAMIAMTTSNSIRVNPLRERIAPSFPGTRGGRIRMGKLPRLAARRNASRDVEVELIRPVLADGHLLLRVHVPVGRDEFPGDDVGAPPTSSGAGRF